MWMMQQPLLPASPRAVANVPKAACNSSGLSSARHKSMKTRFTSLSRFLSQRKENYVARICTKLTTVQLGSGGCCKNSHKTDQAATRLMWMLQELPRQSPLCI